MELGSSMWVSAVADALRASEDYRRAGAGWRWSIGFAFLADDDSSEGGAGQAPDRYVLMDLHDGEVRGASVVDRDEYERATFRMSAPVQRWNRLMSGRLDPMRCIVLKQIRFEGDRLTALRYLPASKAMLNAMATVEINTSA